MPVVFEKSFIHSDTDNGWKLDTFGRRGMLYSLLLIKHICIACLPVFQEDYAIYYQEHHFNRHIFPNLDLVDLLCFTLWYR